MNIFHDACEARQLMMECLNAMPTPIAHRSSQILLKVKLKIQNHALCAKTSIFPCDCIFVCD